VRRVARALGAGALVLVVAGMTAWGAAALHWSDLPSPLLRDGFAALFVLGTLLAFALLPRRRRTLLGFALVFGLLVAWWWRIPASHDRVWQDEVSLLPWAELDGEIVTLHGIRDFEWRSETEYTPRWYDRSFDLRKLAGVDLVASYWMGPDIAHVLVSFDFGDDGHVAVSIETRKEQGEGYSTIAGFFKQYELIYVVADERDVVRVRTNVRANPPEDVYLYRVRGAPDAGRRFFLDYVKAINELRERPRFYNTATTNCTTNVLLHTRVNPGAPPWSWKVLLSGHLPEYAHELGRLDGSRPFPELQRLSRVNERARAADGAPDFSRRIREGLPRPASPR
jgi:hypothetical protein